MGMLDWAKRVKTVGVEIDKEEYEKRVEMDKKRLEKLQTN